MMSTVKAFIGICFFVLISGSLFSQGMEKWTITKVVNCHLDLGVRNPQSNGFVSQRKLYLKRNIYKKGNTLLFSAALKRSESYSDSIFIGECRTFKRQKDDEISYRYPGDELSCEPGREKENKCFVGESFMKMLGSRDSSLRVCKLRGNYPNFYSYKLCIVKENRKMGLLLENTSILLILEPTRTIKIAGK